MIDKWGRGRGMYDITDVLRGLGDAVKRIAVGVGGYYPHPPAPNMFHVEHFAITLYIIRYEFTPPDQFIPYI